MTRRVAYLECFAGISGDMFLGALVGAGVPLRVMERAVAALGLHAGLRVRTVDRSGISAVKLDVLEGEALAEGWSAAVRDGDVGEAGEGFQEQGERGHGVLPKVQHLHKAGHGHSHAHEPAEGPEDGHAHDHKHAAENGHAHEAEAGAGHEVPGRGHEREHREHEHGPHGHEHQRHEHEAQGAYAHEHGHGHEPHEHEGHGSYGHEGHGSHGHEGHGSHGHEGHGSHGHEGHGSHGHEHGQHEHGPGHHEHGPGHHEHGHGRHHGRSLSVIEGMIRGASLVDGVKRRALEAFRLLGESEAKIHNVPVEEIHFHEVGAVDAIVDIVAASAGVEELERQAWEETGAGLRWHCSAVNVGGGMVDCAHGRFPVPAPATADLLRGVPTYAADLEKELVTPTGAALLRMLRAEFGAQPAMRVRWIGYGAGTRNPKGFPNVLRLMVGEAGMGPEAGAEGDAETVVVLETAVDDMNPQVVADVTERLLERGALDVMTSAVGMKKGRQGVLLTVLAEECMAAAMEEVLLRETSTLGVRRRREERRPLQREHVTVETAFGPVRVKVGRRGVEELNARPEFEDCRMAARERGVPLKQVMEAALVAYRTR